MTRKEFLIIIVGSFNELQRHTEKITNLHLSFNHGNGLAVRTPLLLSLLNDSMSFAEMTMKFECMNLKCKGNEKNGKKIKDFCRFHMDIHFDALA